MIGRTDCEKWSIQDCTILRQRAAQWKAAATQKSQEELFSKYGIRWTELWRLPYWNPTRMLVVDPMHCLLEGLAQFYLRNVLKLTTTNAEVKPAPVVAFEYAFPSPTSMTTVNPVDTTEDEVKQITASSKHHPPDYPPRTKEKETPGICYREPRAFYPAGQTSSQGAIYSDIDFMGNF